MTDVVTYDVVPRAGVIDLGKQVEGLVTRVVLPNIRRGEGAVQLVHQRSDDQKPYLVPITEDGDKVYWIVTRSDTAFPGRGQAELQWLGENGAVAKSVTYQTNTTRSMAEPGPEPDEPLKPYTQAVAKDAQAAKDAAASASEAARTAEASAGQAGAAANNAADSLKRLEDGIASGNFRGEKGDKGDPGPQGPQGEVGPAGDTTAADAAAEAAKKAAQEAQKAAEAAVLYTEQHITGSQQEQARSNINAADKSRQNILVGTEIGNPIAVDDAFSAPLCGLTVYGKSTQDGTPSPDAPVPIVSAGDSGSVAVTLSDGNGKTQTITLPTPNGLLGIPVTSGGNYTDENRQQWVCDEVDLARGVKVQRVKVKELSPDDTWAYRKTNRGNNNFQLRIYNANASAIRKPCFCNILRYTGNVWDDIPQNLPKIYTNDQEITISFPPNSEYSSLEVFKQLLTNVKSVIYYALATPIETPLNPAEIAAYKALTAYAPDTVVQAGDGAGIQLKYQRDVNIAIKKLEDAVASMTAT